MGCGEPEKITAFKNTNLVPMTDEKIIENQTVLVKGDRIFAIGPANQVEIPPDAKVIEGQGAYLMPGLADMHGFNLAAHDTAFLVNFINGHQHAATVGSPAVGELATGVGGHAD